LLRKWTKESEKRESKSLGPRPILYFPMSFEKRRKIRAKGQGKWHRQQHRRWTPCWTASEGPLSVLAGMCKRSVLWRLARPSQFLLSVRYTTPAIDSSARTTFRKSSKKLLRLVSYFPSLFFYSLLNAYISFPTHSFPMTSNGILLAICRATKSSLLSVSIIHYPYFHFCNQNDVFSLLFSQFRLIKSLSSVILFSNLILKNMGTYKITLLNCWLFVDLETRAQSC